MRKVLSTAIVSMDDSTKDGILNHPEPINATNGVDCESDLVWNKFLATIGLH